MKLSDPISITFRGAPAQLRVVRHGGFCWGRIASDRDGEYDVIPPKDLYDQADSKALNELADFARDESCVDRAIELSKDHGNGHASPDSTAPNPR